MTDQRTFDDRDGWIWFDGKLVPWREANVHVLTHALHYASSVFEGQRAYGGEIFKLTEHSERLRKSARAARLRAALVSVEEIDAACREVLKANKLDRRLYAPGRLARLGADGRVGAEAPSRTWRSPPGSGATISARRRSAKGIRLDIAPWRRPAPYTAPTESKAVGPLHDLHAVAARRPKAEGYDDALMFDWRGQVAEATGANAFFVSDGALHTPTPDCFLDGITRRTVIDLARRRGIEVIERAIWPEELESFEQFFLTGSAAEVTPVASAGPVELRGRRADAAAPQGLSRPRQPAHFERLTAVAREGRARG